MNRKIKYLRIERCFQFIIVLYLSFQIGCQPGAGRAGLHHMAHCPTKDATNQLRQRLSESLIRTTDPSPEGAGFAIITDSILERHEKREISGQFKMLVQPLVNDISTITLVAEDGKSKGIRERKWYDDDRALADSATEAKIWEEIQRLCPLQP